ncbi:MAG: family oxidoreductase [Devosia sp.]|nr:family oxidoreductase [Devosia sp.]
MKVLVIGAAGMVGRKLVAALLSTGRVGEQAISSLALADVVAPTAPEGTIAVTTSVVDLSRPEAATGLIADRPDLIFHLAAIVSGEAEADFEKGYSINLDGTRHLLETIRLAGQSQPYRPRLVFTSSIAVFGEPLPAVIGDTQHHTPLTSYGTQKAICELLLADYSRRGFVDGIGIRLPTIAVRPGKPNKAASGFFSGIIREPLAGQEALLPVADAVRHWFASPRAAVGFLLHAAAMDTGLLGNQRNLTMPGLAATVGEQIAALERVAGPKAVALIRRQPDEVIAGIVAGWPQAFEATRAKSLGFVGESTFDEIIRIYIEDELGH